MIKNSIFIGVLLVFLSIGLITLFQENYEYLVRGRRDWAWQYSTMFIGLGLVVLGIAWGLRNRLAPRWRYWIVAIPLVSVGQIFLRMVLLLFPEHQAALLKKGYREYAAGNDEVYLSCTACSYYPEGDFFDRNLMDFFIKDTTFLFDYARVLYLGNEYRWNGGATAYSNGYYLTQLSGANHLLWKNANIPIADYLSKRGGDAVLLGMAWAETQLRYDATLEDTHYNDFYAIDNGLSDIPIVQLADFPPRPPYFHQGWLDESNLRSLYRHYLKKLDQLSQNELELLLGLGLYFPMRFIQPSDFDRMVERWKEFQEPFVENINAMQRANQQLRQVFSTFPLNRQQQLPVQFEHPADSVYWMPWLRLLGYEPVTDSRDGVVLSCDVETDLFMKGRDEVIYSKKLTFFYRLPKQSEAVLVLETPEQLIHPYYDVHADDYSLDYSYTNRDPSWLLAIPKSYGNAFVRDGWNDANDLGY